MAQYHITLTGEGEPSDDVRSIFNDTVNALREIGSVTGSLGLAGVPYDAAEVPEDVEPDDGDDGEEDDDEDEEVTP